MRFSCWKEWVRRLSGFGSSCFRVREVRLCSGVSISCSFCGVGRGFGWEGFVWFWVSFLFLVF